MTGKSVHVYCAFPQRHGWHSQHIGLPGRNSNSVKTQGGFNRRGIHLLRLIFLKKSQEIAGLKQCVLRVNPRIPYLQLLQTNRHQPAAFHASLQNFCQKHKTLAFNPL